jgi:hypothetical protein
LRPSKFSAVTSIQLFFPNNISGGEEETTRVYYVGFKGEWNEVNGSCFLLDDRLGIGDCGTEIGYDASLAYAESGWDHLIRGSG